MMNGNEIRDESSDENKKIWQEVDLAASRAPGWVVSRIKSRGQSPNRDGAYGNSQPPGASGC